MTWTAMLAGVRLVRLKSDSWSSSFAQGQHPCHIKINIYVQKQSLKTLVENLWVSIPVPLTSERSTTWASPLVEVTWARLQNIDKMTLFILDRFSQCNQTAPVTYRCMHMYDGVRRLKMPNVHVKRGGIDNRTATRIDQVILVPLGGSTGPRRTSPAHSDFLLYIRDPAQPISR
jgi:hypothetical protein